MKKTLTEQWREGTLNGGYYYLKMKDGNIFIDHTEYIFWAHEIRWETKDSSYVKEVLAPVPIYDEYKELTQRVGRLELDNEVLEDVVQECNKRGLENKKLQEQLKEANKLLKTAGYGSKEKMFPLPYVCPEECRNYLKKWGVK